VSYLIDHQIHCSNQFIERLLSSLNLQAFIECTAELAYTELQASAAAFGYLSELHQKTTVVHPVQYPWNMPELDELLQHVQPIVTAGQSVLVSISEPQVGAMLTRLGFRMALIIPVRSQMQTVHTLVVAWKVIPPHEPDLAHANLVGRYLGLALANAERQAKDEQNRNHG
jgi:GAF domain-containing protein